MGMVMMITTMVMVMIMMGMMMVMLITTMVMVNGNLDYIGVTLPGRHMQRCPAICVLQLCIRSCG
jgi:hypothetical protein